MNGNPAVAFRGTLNGYNKADVNKYIEEINIKFSDTESDYKKIILSQKEQIDNLNLELNRVKEERNELSSVRDQNILLQTEIENAEEQRLEIERKHSESNALIGVLNDKIDEMSNSYGALKEDFNRITVERDNLAKTAGAREEIIPESSAHEEAAPVITENPPAATDNEKARMYDKISRQVGSMLIDAREISDNIISDANLQAEKIIESAENKADEIRGSADVVLNRTLNSIKNSLKHMSSDCMSEYIKHINNSRSALDKLLDDTSSEADSVYLRFDNIINNTLRDLSKDIEKITGETVSDAAETPERPDHG
ncbi:MAG: hypothetical protein PHZ09_13225 [Eubacteriales bacterium]|jgi:cell division septum initiation protein DivIVA|nr:hypothetical protein [Eubacteriales bacterium]